MFFNYKSLIFFVILFSYSCHDTTQDSGFKNGLIVSAKIEASQAGINILKQGGNAFDAMIATELALAVVYPNAGNLGGGGFLVYRLSDSSTGSLDFREKSPLQSKKNMYLDNNGNEIEGLSTTGALSVAVPGTVAGIFKIYEKYASLPLKVLFEPAIKLAENGFVLTSKQAQSLNSNYKIIKNNNDSISLFHNKFKEGDLFINNALANSLRIILKNGRDGFYKGRISKQIIEYVNARNGILSQEDFNNYQAVWRDPIKFKYKDLDIISMGPPSSGGIVLAQILKMIEPYDISKFYHNSQKYIQLLVEAERRSFADRGKYLGDPDFNYIPLKELLNNKYLKERMNNFSFKRASQSKYIKS